jgi:hypothetical protein
MQLIRSVGRQVGLGLVELMVGIVISLIILAGTIYVFIGNTESGLFHLRSTRLVQQMRDNMDLMARDIRRAGYLGYRFVAASLVAPGGNVFSSYSTLVPGTPLKSSDTVNPVSSGIGATSVSALSLVEPCTDPLTDPDRPELGTFRICSGVVYTYNRDDDPVNAPVSDGAKLGAGGAAGVSPVCDSPNYDGGNTEFFGFRIENGVLETLVPSGTACSLAWAAITDAGLVNLFGVGVSGTPFLDRGGFAVFDRCVGYIDRNNNGVGTCTTADTTGTLPNDVQIRARSVEISLVGRSARDPELTFRLRQMVDLPNATSRIL